MKKFLLITILIAIMLSCSQTEQQEEKTPPPLVDRELFFGNADKIQVRFSPDGKYFSYRAPVEGVMNIWVADAATPDQAKPVTNDTVRGISGYQWTYKTGKLIYTQDLGGDENFHVYLVDVASSTTTDLTPQEEIIGPDNVPLKDPNTDKIIRPRNDILSVNREMPDEILIQSNNTDPTVQDVFKVDLNTGEMQFVVKDEGFVQILPDNNNQIRLASKLNAEGGQTVSKYEDGSWNEFFKVPQEDALTFGMVGFNKDNSAVYIIDSRERDKAALYTMDIESGEKELIVESDKSDVSNIMLNPDSYEIEAYATNYLKNEWIPLSSDVEEDINYLKQFNNGDLGIYFRSEDDKTWIVAYDSPKEFLKYYKYDRENKQASLLVSSKPAFDDVTLSQTYPIEIKSRDGLDLVSYLTIPSELDVDGKTSSPAPMVLLVHGGPWARDVYGFNGLHQWLANRGYVTLSVNYRGSTGFGKDFINIAKKEWAGKMHDDLIDAVNWTVEQGIADKENIAIMGGSYGGYATLVGLTFTPDVFKCGVDIVGPSNLNTLLSTIPPYWKSFRDIFVQHLGDPDTQEGIALLEDRSPLNRVDSIRRPLLIGQGANDPRVKQSESDQIVEAMKEKNIPVTYILYPDEGHGFARPENNLSFFAVTEQFLAKHLNGRAQEIGDDFNDSSIEVKEQGGLESL